MEDGFRLKKTLASGVFLLVLEAGEAPFFRFYFCLLKGFWELKCLGKRLFLNMFFQILSLFWCQIPDHLFVFVLMPVLFVLWVPISPIWMLDICGFWSHPPEASKYQVQPNEHRKLLDWIATFSKQRPLFNALFGAKNAPSMRIVPGLGDPKTHTWWVILYSNCWSFFDLSDVEVFKLKSSPNGKAQLLNHQSDGLRHCPETVCESSELLP